MNLQCKEIIFQENKIDVWNSKKRMKNDERIWYSYVDVINLSDDEIHTLGAFLKIKGGCKVRWTNSGE